MSEEKEKKESSAKERKGKEGYPCNLQSLAEYNQTWKDIDDCLKNLNLASN